MATKKQKRQDAIEKRERFLESTRRSGLNAQQKDQQHRERLDLDAWQNNHDKNHSWQKVVVECPHCRIHMRAQKNALATSS